MDFEPNSVRAFAAAPSPSQRRDAHAVARLPHALRAYVVAQRYEGYTDAEHDVWRIVVERYARSTRELAHRIYKPHLDGLALLGLAPDAIPRVEWINARLAPTGWIAACVEGYLPARIYASFLAHRVFPVSRSIRAARHIDFAPTPDLVHDVFGHLPLLFSRRHRTYLRQLAVVTSEARSGALDEALHHANVAIGSLKSAADTPESLIAAAEERVSAVKRALDEAPSEMTELARIFLWSVEFGLIGTESDYRVHGAGLLSSLGELSSVYGKGVEIERYSLAAVTRDIEFSGFQRRYYVFESYDELARVLAEYCRLARGWDGTSQRGPRGGQNGVQSR